MFMFHYEFIETRCYLWKFHDNFDRHFMFSCQATTTFIYWSELVILTFPLRRDDDLDLSSNFCLSESSYVTLIETFEHIVSSHFSLSTMEKFVYTNFLSD